MMEAFPKGSDRTFPVPGGEVQPCAEAAPVGGPRRQTGVSLPCPEPAGLSKELLWRWVWELRPRERNFLLERRVLHLKSRASDWSENLPFLLF